MKTKNHFSSLYNIIRARAWYSSFFYSGFVGRSPTTTFLTFNWFTNNTLGMYFQSIRTQCNGESNHPVNCPSQHSQSPIIPAVVCNPRKSLKDPFLLQPRCPTLGNHGHRPKFHFDCSNGTRAATRHPLQLLFEWTNLNGMLFNSAETNRFEYRCRGRTKAPITRF